MGGTRGGGSRTLSQMPLHLAHPVQLLPNMATLFWQRNSGLALPRNGPSIHGSSGIACYPQISFIVAACHDGGLSSM